MRRVIVGGLTPLVCAALLSGCAVQFLSTYDATTDDITTAMQKAHAGHVLTVLEGQKPDCLYSANKAYYRAARVDASALEMRTAAIPKNQPTSEQVRALQGGVESFERLDQLAERRNACLSGAELAPIDRGMNTIFASILKLEFAKLRGAKRPLPCSIREVAMAGIDIGAVAGDAAAAMLGILKKSGDDIRQFAQAEARKLATSMGEIATLRANGTIDDEEAALHLDIQRNASRAVLMAIQGIGILAAEQAINAAIDVVASALNKVLPIRVF